MNSRPRCGPLVDRMRLKADVHVACANRINVFIVCIGFCLAELDGSVEVYSTSNIANIFCSEVSLVTLGDFHARKVWMFYSHVVVSSIIASVIVTLSGCARAGAYPEGGYMGECPPPRQDF